MTDLGEAFKVDSRMEEKHKKLEEEKKKFAYFLDEDQTEIKKLTMEDIEDIVKVMRKCSFDVTDKEVSTIIVYDTSFGSYVNRMLIGVGLSWPAHLDLENKIITGRTANALYLEDPAVLLAYEGRGLRRVLVEEREKFAKTNGLKYVIAYLYEDIKGSVEDHIKEAGNSLEKLYLSEGYKFLRTPKGILAMKEV